MQYILIIAWCGLVAYLAKKKGRNPFLYGGLCLIVSPLIMLIVVLCVSDKNKMAQNVQGMDAAPYGNGQPIDLDESQYTIEDEPQPETYTESPTYLDSQVEIYSAPVGPTCPACGSAVKEGAKFCENCGWNLEEK